MKAYSETPDIVAFPTSPTGKGRRHGPFKSELQTQAELETLKGGTLRLLDEVGVHFPSRNTLEVLAFHGAKVDMETEIVRIPPDLVQKAMSTARGHMSQMHTDITSASWFQIHETALLLHQGLEPSLDTSVSPDFR
jgi:trimethylamine:corrinoid methyltransferase-like protein